MVLSEEEKKERHRISSKKYNEKNKEKGKRYLKEYYQKNKEKYKEYQKKWRQGPVGKKSSLITCWKGRGIVSSDYNLLYDNYLASTNCEECGVEYGKVGDGSGTWKCLDHSHETGLFRNYLCNTCNIIRR